MPRKKEASEVRRNYEFIKLRQGEYKVRLMCKLLDVAPSGYYAWLKTPVSNHAKHDARLLRLIRASFNEGQCIYGAPRVFLDLREAGESCSKHRVARLMRENRMRAQPGYKTRRYIAGKSDELIPNLVKRNFDVSQPNKVWVTDITYIRTWEGWLYVAVRRRKPNKTIIHSNQGSQYSSDDWLRFCRTNNLEPSMSRRGNCWDNAVAESFFSSLKKERIKKRIYKNRKLAIEDVSDYIDMFYNRTRRHQHLGGVSPDEFEAAC